VAHLYDSQEMLEARLDIVYSCVKSPYFTESWIGRKLDEDALCEMTVLAKDGLDLNGERGEYHTIVVGGPMYDDTAKRVVLRNQHASELHGSKGQADGVRWWAFSDALSVHVEPVTTQKSESR
jgi:diphthamide synthase (EF-2-diphthine--ammonia ligase)